MDESRSASISTVAAVKGVPVVLVHGIWMHGVELVVMKHRLQSHHGFECHLFSYPSVRGTLDENAELLADYVRDAGLAEAHLVGHSLGGVVALRMLSLDSASPRGRVVCLGSPLSGSRAAEHLNSHDWGQSILGNTITEGVVDEAANEWARQLTDEREIGVIAGTMALGLGRLLVNFEGANDGTVAVSETRLDGARDHLRMPVSHSGLVLSKDAADQTAEFLKRGEFLR